MPTPVTTPFTTTSTKKNHSSSLFFAMLSVVVCLAVVLGLGLLSGCQAPIATAEKDPVQAQDLVVFPAPTKRLDLVSNKILYWRQDPTQVAAGDLSLAQDMARMAEIGQLIDRADAEVIPYAKSEEALNQRLEEIESELSETTDPELRRPLEEEQAAKLLDLEQILKIKAPLEEQAERLTEETKSLVRWTIFPPERIRLSFTFPEGGAPQPALSLTKWQVDNQGATRDFDGASIQKLSYEAVGGVLKFRVVTSSGEAGDEFYEFVVARTNYRALPATHVAFSGDFIAFRRNVVGKWQPFAYGCAKFANYR